ncbi:MAG: hypothetical protein KAW16_04820 [candidate division Zixibacteria bacterium]|nr:hypothetical protein [candidate division Zixibacteria bacterium]
MPKDEFTYQKPDERAYFNTLVKYLERKGEKDILQLLVGGHCTIDPSSTFSHVRWNGLWTTVYFYVPLEKLDIVNDEIKKKLTGLCDLIMPAEVGFDVMSVQFSPLLSETDAEETLLKDLENITQTMSGQIISQILPDDIREKGKDMMEAYFYLYCVENSLRLFVEKVAKEKWGDQYFTHLQLNKDILRGISYRKQQEMKNKWLRLRGDSDIFYLDFKDLGTVIQNNWGLFSPYFPNQSWILSKINELADCRNLVAHNSFIQSHEKDVIRVNYNSILKQLQFSLRSEAKGSKLS